MEGCFALRPDVKYPHLGATTLPNLEAKLYLGAIRNELIAIESELPNNFYSIVLIIVNNMSNKYKCKKWDCEYKTKNSLRKHIKEKHSLFAIIKKYKWILSIFTIISIITSITIFYYSYKPDLQIETNNVGGVDWNNLEYYFNIKNYGRSTADSVEVALDLDYWKGQTGIIK